MKRELQFVRACGFDTTDEYENPKFGELLGFIRGGINVLGAVNVNGLERERRAWGEVWKIINLGIRELESRGGSYPKVKCVTRKHITATSEGVLKKREESVVVAKPPESLIEAFNRLAKTMTPHLRVNSRGELDHDPGDDPEARIVLWLWNCYFELRGWERVKRCARCGTVFVDMTKNGSMRFGSEACRNRFWNRGERRRAGHVARRSPSYRKGKGVKQRGSESF